MKKIVVIGCMDNTLDNTFESANRVYDRKYTCPTIPTCGGGGIQPKVIKNVENIRKSGSGGERGRVVSPKSVMTALSATDYKDPPKTIKRIQMSDGVIERVNVKPCAMRGRSGVGGGKWKQQIEISQDKAANAITTISKDSMYVCEVKRSEDVGQKKK